MNSSYWADPTRLKKLFSAEIIEDRIKYLNEVGYYFDIFEYFGKFKESIFGKQWTIDLTGEFIREEPTDEVPNRYETLATLLPKLKNYLIKIKETGFIESRHHYKHYFVIMFVGENDDLPSKIKCEETLINESTVEFGGKKFSVKYVKFIRDA